MLHTTVLRDGCLEMQLVIVLGAMHRSRGETLLQCVYLQTFNAFCTLTVHFCKGREFGEVTTGSEGQWLAEVG